MIRIQKYLFAILCLLNFILAGAQDTTTTVLSIEEMDTSYIDGRKADTYNREEFGFYDSTPRIVERNASEEALNRVREDEAYWYANLEPKPKKKKKEPEVVVENTDWVNSLFWILLVGGFIALLIWLLSTSNITLFQRSSRDMETTEEEPGENIFELNFDREIQAAVAKGNYRLGVRLMYLQVLRIMADKGLIQYTAEKTNSDYLFQLSNSRYSKDFSRLTRNFDYVWYGEFPVSSEGFEILHKDFSNFKKALG